MLAPTDVPKPNHTLWLAGDGYLRVVQPEPRREIYFAGEAALLWELVDAQEWTVAELLVRMAAHGVPEERTRPTLERMHAMRLITVENFLWKEGAQG